VKKEQGEHISSLFTQLQIELTLIKKVTEKIIIAIENSSNQTHLISIHFVFWPHEEVMASNFRILRHKYNMFPRISKQSKDIHSCNAGANRF